MDDNNCKICAKADSNGDPIPELCTHKKHTGIGICRAFKPKSVGNKEMPK